MKVKVSQYAPNHFVITTKEGQYFQSYSSVIVFQPRTGPLQLDAKTWNYSRTTAKYRNQFTGLTTKETEKKIAAGEIILVDLN